jgi:hypothetical protein
MSSGKSFGTIEDFIRNPTYERRVVVFYDILGWRSQIGQAGTDPNKIGNLRRMILRLSRMLAVQRENVVPEIRFTTFSDNVVISQPSGSLTSFLLFTLGYFQFGSATAGLMVRGGVTIGDIIHDEHTVFGPALNRAYELESQVADVPRIVLDPDLVEELKRNAPFISAENGIHFVDPFTSLFLGMVRALDTPKPSEFWDNVGMPRPSHKGSLRTSPTDYMLRGVLDGLKGNLQGPLTDKEWHKLAWLYDRIARQLGVPPTKSYPWARSDVG